jgi:hypothetical protein
MLLPFWSGDHPPVADDIWFRKGDSRTRVMRGLAFMDLEKLRQLIERWQTLLVGIGLLVTAAVAVRTQLLSLKPWEWSWPEIVLILLAILAVASLVFRSRRAHLSRLIDPEALKLDPQSPDQLLGRREDLDKLLTALANPLVFLVSESGCGKSALLRAGVALGPAFLERFLPIYIDMSVLDWEDGPLRAARDGFARALPPDDPLRGRLDARSTPRQYAEAFADHDRRTHRRLLLLLDQFDDYQAQPRHHDRFLPLETRVWRTADVIARENAFWRALRQCLQADAISIVVACRDDASQGLESFRFRPDVQTFDLPRLGRGLVRTIIDRLTDRPANNPPVIADPEGGWTSLRDHLVDDLEARGQILPQQLKVVLGGLRSLRRLTPAAYAHAGRLGGLEAALVAGAIERAARAAGLTDTAVLNLLLPLVDRTRQPPDKAPPQTAIVLASSAAIAPEAAARALERLESDEIIRRRGDAAGDTGGWQLDHAYLALPILHIERERDQWRQLLAERARAYGEAGWRGKWRALLPLGLQVRLLAARLRRGFTYGRQRGYALKSIVRGFPVLGILGLVYGGGWAVSEYDRAGRIEGEIASVSGEMFGLGTPLPDYAAHGLADLATASWIARWRFERDVFGSQQLAVAFMRIPGPVLRAWVRLDPARLDSLVRKHVTPQALRQSDRVLGEAAAVLAAQTSPVALTGKTRAAFENAVISSFGEVKADLTKGLRVIADALPVGDPKVHQLLTSLRDKIGKTSDRSQVYDLAQAYAAFAAKLKGADPLASSELASLRQAIGEIRDAY